MYDNSRNNLFEANPGGAPCNVHITLAFVQTAADGDRDFSFYRNPGADMMLTEDEVEMRHAKRLQSMQ